MPIGDKNIERIKGNIKLMIDKGAPNEDIDGYLGEEGITLAELQKPSKGAGFSVGNMIGNIPGSAVDYGKAVIQPVVDPVETGIGLANIVSGAITKGASKIHPVPEERLQEEDVKAFDTVSDFYKERYGSVDGFLKALEKDPIGVAADISTLFSGGGAALKAGGLTKAAGVANKLATITDPVSALSVAKRAIPKAIVAAKSNAPEMLYQKAMKPSTTLTEKAKASRIGTALKEDIPVSVGGLKKSKNTIKEINDEITERINQFENLGQTASLDTAIGKLEYLKKTVREKNLLPDADLSQIDSVIEEIKKRPASQVSIKEAQTFKQTLNKELDDFYKAKSQGKVVPPKMYAQTRVALADGLREEITSIFPEIKMLNQRESALIELNKSLNQAVNRIGNNNLLPLIASIFGAGVGGKVGFLTALGAYTVNNPFIKSKLAIVLHKARSRALIEEMKAMGKSRQAAFQAGRVNEQIEAGQ